jgi:hypothetical protein
VPCRDRGARRDLGAESGGRAYHPSNLKNISNLLSLFIRFHLDRHLFLKSNKFSRTFLHVTKSGFGFIQLRKLRSTCIRHLLRQPRAWLLRHHIKSSIRKLIRSQSLICNMKHEDTRCRSGRNRNPRSQGCGKSARSRFWSLQ